MAISSMMQQYLQIKDQNPDALLLFRVGDFYELFFDDAELVSRETGCAVFSLDTAISSVNYLSARTQNIDTIKEALG